MPKSAGIPPGDSEFSKRLDPLLEVEVFDGLGATCADTAEPPANVKTGKLLQS